MNCYFCGKTFVILDKFIFHLEYVYNVQYNYVCNITVNCRRAFHKRFVYKKHIKNKHSIQSTKFKELKNLSVTNNNAKLIIPTSFKK